MNLLLTGASGFIGKHFLADINLANYNVKVITRSREKQGRFLAQNHQAIIADLTDYESLNIACKEIDVIVNIAGEVRDTSKLNDTNVHGIRNLVKAAENNSVSTIIHLSSVGVIGKQYNSNPITVDEETICNPQNSYEKSKLQSEEILLKHCQNNGIKLHILRPTNVFGEYHPFHAALHLIKHISAKKIIVATKEALVNYVYVKDVSDSIIHLLQSKEPSSIYTIGKSILLKDFVQIISEKINVKNRIIFIPTLWVRLFNKIQFKKLNATSNQINYSDKKISSIFKYNWGVKKGIEQTILFYQKEKLLP